MKKNFFPFIIIAGLLLILISCKKDKINGSGDDKLPPEISAVTDLTNRDIALTAVQYGDWIIIKGKHLATTFKVDFNTVQAADSLIYADDSTVTVKIPATLPDPANNPITVTTKYGTATYNFRILQPAPVITSFDPGAGPAGVTVTITGDYFAGVSSVKFETVEATIISNTKTEIKVTVPAGVTYGYIFVTTPSGTVKSINAFGFRYLIYDDALTATWSNTSFSATAVLTNTTPVKRGTMSIKTNYTASFGALRLSKATPSVSITGYTALKFSLYAGPASLGKKVKIYFNGVSASGYTYTITEVGKWIDVQIPLTNLGNPVTLSSVTMQEFSAILQEVYVDDLGLI